MEELNHDYARAIPGIPINVECDYVLRFTMDRVQTLVVGRCRANCYVVHDGEDVGIIDPGAEGERIAEAVAKTTANPRVSILLTHGHADQIGAVTFLAARFPAAPVYAGKGDNLFLFDAGVNLSRQAGAPVTLADLSSNIKNVGTGDEIRIGSIEFRVAETPGHTPGSISFICPSLELCFCGDTILCGGVGGTSLPFGDDGKLLSSIREHILPLPDTFKLLPAHGTQTDIGRERSSNPYLLALGT